MVREMMVPHSLTSRKAAKYKKQVSGEGAGVKASYLDQIMSWPETAPTYALHSPGTLRPLDEQWNPSSNPERMKVKDYN